MNFFPEDTGGHPRRSGVTLQSTRFTHERSWNEDCILHVRIPFFNWMTVFL